MKKLILLHAVLGVFILLLLNKNTPIESARKTIKEQRRVIPRQKFEKSNYANVKEKDKIRVDYHVVTKSKDNPVAIEKAKGKLLYLAGPESEITIEEEGEIITKNKKTIKAKVTIKNKSRRTRFMASIDPDSGKILDTWNTTRYEYREKVLLNSADK